MSGDTSLASRAEFQQAVKLILNQYLTGHFELIPTLLVPDGSFMIDRRLGLYGHPLDIEILFYAGLLCAREILSLKEENGENIEAVTHRLGHLAFHISEYYWLDLARLNKIYRFGTEEYGETTENRYNIYAASIPEWILEWLPRSAGYFVGNLGPGRMDFRFFSSGNLLAVLSSLANKEQSEAIMNLIEARWQDLIGEMPMKLCFPALEGEEWRLLTGHDAKNVPWSYQNAGSWPFLIWMLVTAAIKTNRTHLAQAAFEIALRRLPEDSWPEYYDGKTGRLIGKEARKLQSWTLAGFLAAYCLLDNKAKANWLLFAEQPEKNTCELEV